jgi:predicted transcriptional regulator
MDINEIDWMEVAVKANREKKEADAQLAECIVVWDKLRKTFEKDFEKLKRELKKEKAARNQDQHKWKLAHQSAHADELAALQLKLHKKEENANLPMPTPQWEKLVTLGEQDKVILKFLQKYKLCPDIDRISNRTGIDIYKLNESLCGLLHNNLIATQALNGGTWYQITPAGVYCLTRWSKMVKPKNGKLKLAIQEVCKERPHRHVENWVSIEDICKAVNTDGLDGIMKYRGVGKVFRRKLEDSIAKRGIDLSNGQC